MPVSILIVSYEVRDLLARCLSSLAEAARPAAPAAGPGGAVDLQVIVADNASRDGTGDLVRRDFPEVSLVPMRENVGFSSALNAAARLARGDVLLLLNPDAMLPPGSLPQMVEHLHQNGAAALGVRQVDSSGFYQLAWGPGPSLAQDLLRRAVQVRLDRKDARVARWVDGLAKKPRAVPWVAASCLLVRKEAFDAVGGFDEGFFLYFEDIDFCLRLGELGHRVVYDPSITIVHERGASAKVAPGPARAAYRDSQRRFWRKHRGPWVGGLIDLYVRWRSRAEAAA